MPVREPLRQGGWYPDPFDAAAERWWDGTKWTQTVRGAPQSDAALATGQGDAAVTAPPRGMAPGWYPWRGEVWRWWDGREWGEARRPVAGRDESVAPPSRRTRAPRRHRVKRRVRARYVLAGLVVLVGVGVAIGLAAQSAPATYMERVAALCTQASARYQSEISQLGSGTTSSRKYSETVFAGQLFAVVLHNSVAFDSSLSAIVPPQALRGTQERYLMLDREDDALYAPLIPRLEHRQDVRQLAAIQRRVSKNELELKGLLKSLGGTTCSVNSPGLG
jgi:hypothetical protein